jgi:Cu-Zn family superoxide dismutase
MMMNGYHTVKADDAIAHVSLITGTLKGTIFFAQNSTTNVVTMKLDLTSGVNVGSNYSFWLHTYGDNNGATTHGGCFPGQTSAFAGAQPDDTTWTGITETSSFSLTGASSILGRTIAVYENLTENTCAAATAATPVSRGVIGAAYPEAGTTNPAAAPLTSDPVSAIAEIWGGAGNEGIWGTVTFQMVDGLMKVMANITGGTTTMTSGQHALHVHQYGDLSMANGTSAGGHWNPYGRYHGEPTADWKHAGDMGNVTVVDNAIIHIDAYTQLTFQGIGSIIGRGVVLHALRDDGNPTNSSTSVGDAGGRIARGVIGISNRTPVYPSFSSSSSSTGMNYSSSSTGVSGASSQATMSFATIAMTLFVAVIAATF